MKQIKVFLKNINVLNLLLLAMAIFLFFEWDYPLIDKKIKVTIPQPKEGLIKSEEKAFAERAVTYLDYAAITEKNIFHPERKMPVARKEAQSLAKPEIILCGTLITSEKRVAYMEDKKAPYSTPGRGQRQVAVNEGSMIAGYKLAEVNVESVLLVRGEDKMMVTLSTHKERKLGGTSSKPTSPSSTSRHTPPLQMQVRPAHPSASPLSPAFNLR